MTTTPELPLRYSFSTCFPTHHRSRLFLSDAAHCMAGGIVAQACRFENPSALINSTTSSGFAFGHGTFFHYILRNVIGEGLIYLHLQVLFFASADYLASRSVFGFIQLEGYTNARFPADIRNTDYRLCADS